MERRRFLRLSIGGGLALSGAAVVHRLLFDYATPGSKAALPAGCLSVRERVILRAVALRILAGAEPDPQVDGAAAQCAFIDKYLARLDAGMRGDVKALLSLLEVYPTLTGRFSRFSHLSISAQDDVLHSWERSGTALLRQGLQALKAMCVLAHYQDERSFATIGYTGPLVPPQGLGRVLSAP